MQISALCPSATRVSLAWIPSGNALVSPALGNFRSLLVALRGTAIPRRKGTPAAAALPRQGGGWVADINAFTLFFFFFFSTSLFSLFFHSSRGCDHFLSPFYLSLGSWSSLHALFPSATRHRHAASRPPAGCHAHARGGIAATRGQSGAHETHQDQAMCARPRSLHKWRLTWPSRAPRDVIDTLWRHEPRRRAFPPRCSMFRLVPPPPGRCFGRGRHYRGLTA